MKNIKTAFLATSSVMVLAGALSFTSVAMAAGAKVAESSVDEGQTLAFTRKKGNCLACHAIVGGKAAGNIGPPLIAMKARYQDDKAKLRAQIYDAEVANPETAMPPFGRLEALSGAEIDKITDFIWTL